MTTLTFSEQLRHVVQAAVLAPSIHNTQPWRFVERPDGFELHADRTRQLQVLDLFGRQLHLSCGAALAHARVAARALGLEADVALLPEPSQPDLLARVVLTAGAAATGEDIELGLAILRRHTARGAYAARPVPVRLLEELRRAAAGYGAMLRVVRPAERPVVAALLARADAAETRDQQYRDEVAAWVRPAAGADGIPEEALGLTQTADGLRLRDFRGTTPDQLGDDAPAPDRAEVVVLTTDGDDRTSWLQAGQALGAVLLVGARHGLQAQPLGQVTDLPGPRRALADELGLLGVPQLALRVGWAEATAVTPRRPVDDVLVAGSPA